MRALIVGDIHSNLEAFQSVLADAEARGGFDIVWCLGDTVGYGPDPGACMHLLRQYDLLAVAGNHDHAAVGKMDVSTFNHAAAAAARWTKGQLTTDEKVFPVSAPFNCNF